jgi:putative toxin-antitoxin system antitoxin component (TIGR02293 family)
MTVMAQAVARRLGDERELGTAVRSESDLALLVEKRLPLSALGHLQETGFTVGEISMYVINSRTKRHRATKSEPLTVEESDRVVRLARIALIAEETFGDVSKAHAWLRKPLSHLGGRKPLDIARTEIGARLVESILAKMAWGAAA